MALCTFCGHAPAVNFALTVLNGDPSHAASWRREVLPVYPRWHRALAEAVAEGRPPEVDGLAGLQAKAVCYACYESSLAGKPVRPADVESGKVNAYQRPIDAHWKI